MRHLKILGLSLLAVATLATAAVHSPPQPAAIQPPSSSTANTPMPTTTTTTATTAAASAIPTAPIPLLWKVSDADNAVYLLGSFHLLKPDDYPVSADIDTAFAAADKIVFEVPPEQLADPANAQKFLAAAGYGDARTLSTVLPERLHEKLSRLLAQQGGSVTQLDGYEPWFVNLSLMLGVSQTLGFSAEQGLDHYLMQQAAAAGKPTAGLESMDLQLQALDASPMPEQIRGLADFLDRPQEMPGMLGELHAAWRSGDVARLDELSSAEMREKTPVTYQIVNVDRNNAWTPQLQAMLDGPGTDDTLVVVGALHLLGEDGVVEKLRAKGYQVARICSACESTPVAVE